MSNDPRDDEQQDSGEETPGGDSQGTPTPDDYPAPWSRREEGTVDMDAGEEGEASFLAGDEMSLGSKLRGGGQDQSEKAGQATRLCPACNVVTVFVDGKCTNCDYLLGSSGHEGVAGIRQAVEGDDENPFIKVLLILGIVIVVVVLLAVGIPRLLSSRKPAQDSAAQPEVDAYQGEGVYAGALNEIEINDQLHTDIQAALKEGNMGWAAEDIDAYVYKYNIYSEVRQATSQVLRISSYVGGADATAAVNEPRNVHWFDLGTADLLDRLNATPGVEASFRLYNTGGEEPARGDDVYIKYGYYFGLEHMNTLQPIIDSLNEYYNTNGEYPHLLSERMLTVRVKTKRGFYYERNGAGYLPVFRTDSRGNIIMGTGSGVEALQPDACIGYYLFMYTENPDEGLDLHDEEALDYYSQHIAPFPYDPDEPVKNVVLEPDGEPDGIACVVKDGVLLEL